ncbi:MAG TPA: Wzz/FepE/Etk N-terminal domain-containing protein [Candidatus Dormibacteraeota bacterium]|nr:Wzz/FepE/Etk N-terminal domain-containing protein [Candidatus Dormibacteraeota bacterium]
MGGALRRRWWVIAAVVAACLVAGIVVVALSRPTYQAQATLLVDARWEGATDPDAALRASDTLSQVYIAEATDEGLLQDVINANGLAISPSALARRFTVGTVHGTTLLAIKATSVTPGDAAAIANAVAQALVDRNTREVKARFDSTIKYLDDELASLTSKIAAVEAEHVTAANASDHAARLALLQNQYSTTYAQRQSAALGEDRGIATLSLSERAVPPGSPSSPEPARYLLVALAGGVILGLFAALLLERFDDRVFTPESLASATGSPMVVSIPRIAAERTKAYDLVRAALRTRYPDSKLVMLAAASARDHADRPAAELAAAAAHGGEKVLVVRADADQNGIPHPGTANSNGSSVTTIPLPSTLDAMTAFSGLANGSSPYDFTVLSVPSPDRSAAILSLAGSTRVAMLVATSRRTHLAEARRTAELLRQAGVNIVGSLFLTSQNRVMPPAREGAARKL